MSGYNRTPFATETAGAAITQLYLRVHRNGANIEVAGDGDDDLGVITRIAPAIGDHVAVLALNHGSTVPMVAAGVIADGATVNQAAGGKVAATGTNPVGVARKAAAANNDVIEVFITK